MKTIARTRTRRSSDPLITSWAGPRRGLAVFVATLCLFAQFSILGHMLLVRHVACPEHGELIHAEDAADHAVRAPDLHAPPGETSLVSESGPPAGHGHDQCFVLSERRDSVAVAPPSEASIAPAAHVAGTQSATPRAPVRGASRALYLLAPKNSPPA